MTDTATYVAAVADTAIQIAPVADLRYTCFSSRHTSGECSLAERLTAMAGELRDRDCHEGLAAVPVL